MDEKLVKAVKEFDKWSKDKNYCGPVGNFGSFKSEKDFVICFMEGVESVPQDVDLPESFALVYEQYAKDFDAKQGLFEVKEEEVKDEDPPVKKEKKEKKGKVVEMKTAKKEEVKKAEPKKETKIVKATTDKNIKKEKSKRSTQICRDIIKDAGKEGITIDEAIIEAKKRGLVSAIGLEKRVTHILTVHAKLEKEPFSQKGDKFYWN